MLRRSTYPALVAAVLAATAFAAGAALAQSATPSPGDVQKMKDLPGKIHDKLTEQGFKDVQIVPGSYIVSAKDKNGAPVMMVIGPGSMSIITMAPEQQGQGDDQSQSQSSPQDGIIQQ